MEPATNRPIASIRIEATSSEYRRLLAWARRWPERRWAVECATGRAASRAVAACPWRELVDVHASATARVRQVPREGGRKNDAIDAAGCRDHRRTAGRSVPGDGRGPHHGACSVFERRVNLAQARVRTINQLHAVLRDPLPGGAPLQLTASTAAALLRRIRPTGPVEVVREQLAKDLVAELRAVEAQLATNARSCARISRLAAAC